MRRALAITIVSLAGALLVIVLACSSDPIIIATIEAGAGHSSCEVPDGGGGAETDAGQFCSAPCGSRDGSYEIIDSPDCGASGPECGCDGISYFNSCVRQEAHISRAGRGPCALGMPGMTPIQCSDGRCQPKRLGCSIIEPFSFAELVGNFCPGVTVSDFCRNRSCPDFPSLAFLGDLEAGNPFPYPTDAGNPFPDRFGNCWALPPSCPSSSGSPRVQRPCDRSCTIDECKAVAMRSVGPYFPCEPDGSPN